MLAPEQILERLEEIEQDLATRQNDIEAAAEAWYKLKRDREKQRAMAFMQAQGTVAEREARATLAIAEVGVEEEARYEALKHVVRTLETRASIGQTLARTNARAAA